MRKEQDARPLSLAAQGRATSEPEPDRAGDDSAFSIDHCILIHKRGRLVTIAKIVTAEPLGERVIAMVYRDPSRPVPTTPSLPPAVIEHARACGAVRWVVRIDHVGECYGMALTEVERHGWIAPSEGRPERFVRLQDFEAIALQTWAYVNDSVEITLDDPLPSSGPGKVRDCSLPEGRQLDLFKDRGAA